MEILRDALGVPHCYADDEHAAFRAQGWVHAIDRLWQMEHDRRRALGRLSEVVGAKTLASDLFHRRMGLASFVRRDYELLSASAVAMLEAYSEGVNAAVAAAEHPPREFSAVGIDIDGWETWEPWHSLLVFRVRHLRMGSARSKLWRSMVAEVLGPDIARSMVAGWGEDQIACVPPGARCETEVLPGLGDVDGGSNSWLLAGSRTASGLPLLAGDPHRELEAPNVYVQGHLACPEWNVLGIGMPGVPGFPHFGHNERVAWSITHAMADDQDLYVVPPGPLPGARTERIEVRGGEPVDVEVVHTERGPIVGEGLALCWTATADVNLGFDAIPAMLRAASVDELFEAMRPWVEPANSLLAADVDGTIGYLLRGRLPVRRRPDAAFTPVPADDDSYRWEGWVPFEDLPRCVNPSEGFLFSANNPVAASAAAPYVGLDTAAPWRARRIVDFVASTAGAGVEDMERLHRDVVSLPAQRLRGRLDGWPPLEGWDGAMASSSTAAAAYSVLRRELMLLVLDRSGLSSVLEHPRNRLLPGVVPESVLWRVVEQHMHAGDTTLLGGWSWDDTIAQAQTRAEASWHGETWGELHRSNQRHLLGDIDPELHPPRRVAVSGDLDTVFATSYTPTAGFDVNAGSVARYAFDLADWDRSGWVVPLGASGAPPGDHADDQQQAWAEGRLLPAPYSRAAVEASTSNR